MNKDIFDGLRKEYVFKELTEDEIFSDPFDQFEKWFNDAIEVNGVEANAMFLSTSSLQGMPSVRTVLLKHFDKKGFVFYTNYSSRKGNDLNENPNASILFYWRELERQVRIEGAVEKVSREESDMYFHSRPLESQIAALASNQSTVLKNREELERKFNELKKKYESSITPLPETWGGYRVIAQRIEFWQGRMNRMHDRILFTNEHDSWKIERLSP